MSKASRIRKSPSPREVVCAWCEAAFSARGPNAKFCSTSCREKSRYSRDRQTRLLSAQNYRRGNADRINAGRRERYRENKDQFRIRNRQNYLKHRERRIAYAIEYQRQNPHIVAATRVRRESVQKFAVSGRDLIRLVQRQRNECAYCGCEMSAPGRAEATSLQWDHIVPLKRGGNHSIGNVVAACRTCNIRKSSMLLTEWKRNNLLDQFFTKG